MIQRCTNHTSHSESFNAVQIFQLCIIPWLYKSFEVVQILQRSKKSFDVVQIIYRNKTHSTQYTNHSTLTTNNSTLCKKLNAVQIIQRSSNLSTQCKSINVIQIIQRYTYHSTQYKSFNVVQICTNLSNLSPNLLIIYDSVIQQS